MRSPKPPALPSLFSAAAISLIAHAGAGALAFALTSAAYLRLGKAQDVGAVRVGAIQEIDVQWQESPARATHRTRVANPVATSPAAAKAAMAPAGDAGSGASATASARAATSPSPGSPAAATTPAGGPGNAGASAHGGAPSDLAQIRDAIAARLRYPTSLRARRIVGRVELALSIDAAGGHLDSARIALSSGSAELDALALEAARKTTSFPGLSPETKKKGRLELSLPIEFTIR